MTNSPQPEEFIYLVQYGPSTIYSITQCNMTPGEWKYRRRYRNRALLSTRR